MTIKTLHILLSINGMNTLVITEYHTPKSYAWFGRDYQAGRCNLSVTGPFYDTSQSVQEFQLDDVWLPSMDIISSLLNDRDDGKFVFEKSDGLVKLDVVRAEAALAGWLSSNPRSTLEILKLEFWSPYFATKEVLE